MHMFAIAMIRILTCLTIILILIALHCTDGQMNAGTIKQIGNGISKFKGVVDKLKSLTSDKDMISHLQQLSGYLGVTGALISFALSFVPSQDSAELRYMKDQFAEVNVKLNRITNDLDNIKDIITLESQRGKYIEAASKILLGYDQLTKHYLKDLAAVTSCSTSRECLRKRLAISESYADTFNVKASLYMILRGTTQSTSVFGDPLLDLIKRTYKCDLGKVQYFANGVIKLAFKGQQVVLAYEKLKGTNTSISLAMKDWSLSVYNVRKKVDDVKMYCNREIDKYMKEDIEDTLYQRNINSNKKAAESMKSALDKKYPWVFWIVASFEGDNHWGFSTFQNMPTEKENRKRVLRVVAQDKGTYSDQRQKLSSALEKIAKEKVFSISDAKSIYHAFQRELKKTTIWNSLSSFLVLPNYKDLHVVTDIGHDLYYYDEELPLIYAYANSKPVYIRFLASFKSQEQISGASCTKSCNDRGVCMIMNYSSRSSCSCNAFYQGENCETFDKISLATSIDGMLAVTARIPKISDIYYELLDMRDYIGASLGRLEDSIAALDANLQAKFDQLSGRLAHEFQWANLITHYSKTMTDLSFYLEEFQSFNTTKHAHLIDRRLLSEIVTRPDHAKKWVSELDHLIVGRKYPVLVQHKPLLFILMDKHNYDACTKKYKDALDNAWRQIIILQNRAYILWAQARSILGESSDGIMNIYNEKLLNQELSMKRSTCDLIIPNSINLQCTGGFYMYPGLRVENKCREGHYLVGGSSLSCYSGTSSCKACNCYQYGSYSPECRDQSGQCPCRNNYYGTTCKNRNCIWSPFGSYGPCSITCNYGGTKTRTRTYAYSRKGDGKDCTGNAQQSVSCFNNCCPGSFHCAANKKCVPWSYKCDYDNDCGNSEDEDGCEEICDDKPRQTESRSAGGGNAVYLDKHKILCNDNNKILNMFVLRRSGSNIYYSYTCCKLLRDVCSKRSVSNAYSYNGRGNTVYLDRQTVSCGSKGLLKDFWLDRSGDTWRYSYNCCDMIAKYQNRLSCYDAETSFKYDGRGKNYYLDQHTVSCKQHGDRYFLQKFRLLRNRGHGQIHYVFTCCRIAI